MANIYDLFENIKKRPGAFLFERSITDLRTLMTGYYLAKMELNITPTEQDLEFDRFQQWIQNKYNVTASKSWATIILENSNNETEAFNGFFELLEEFKNEIKLASQLS